MVIQGGSFKGKSGDLKPKEVVSLLLDDEETEKKIREKMEEDEKQENNKMGKKRTGTEIKAVINEIKKPKNETVNCKKLDNNGQLVDFAGDKIGPQKLKSKGFGKRGRPKGSGRATVKQQQKYKMIGSNIQEQPSEYCDQIT